MWLYDSIQFREFNPIMLMWTQYRIKTEKLYLLTWEKVVERKPVVGYDSRRTWACNFIKKRLWHRCFPVNFVKFSWTPSSQSTSGRLLLWLTKYEILIVRSSHQRYSIKKGVLKIFSKFTGKHLCQSPFLNKVSGVSLQH